MNKRIEHYNINLRDKYYFLMLYSINTFTDKKKTK